MRTSCLSSNLAETDVALEAYRSWINSKISKLKKFWYKVSKRNFCYGFVPLMELWKIQNTPLCLPAPEVKEVIQEDEEDSGHPECVMEEAVTQLVTSKE